MPKGPKPRPILERFLEKFKVNLKTGCWEWTSTCAGAGYGILFSHHVKGKVRFVYAHRFSYQQFVGPIPEGQEIDHICKNKKCVFYKHLRTVTHRENMLSGDTVAGHFAKRTHCIRGHEFTKENTHIHSKGYRVCKACWSFYHKKYKDR
jgi:hypothetical protein